MATPTRQAVETYMSVTGASESLALRELEEHGGDLFQAVNAHFAKVVPSSENPPLAVNSSNSSREMSGQTRSGQHGLLPILSAVRSFKPSSLLDPSYRRNFLNQIGVSTSRSSSPVGSPMGNTGANEALDVHPDYRTQMDNQSLYENYTEQHMIQAAIEASKQEVSSGSSVRRGQVLAQDEELDRAIALSLMTAELEEAELENEVKDRAKEVRNPAPSDGAQKDTEEQSSKKSESQRKFAKKVESLPEEPAPDNGNAISLVVRMPDGSRHGRRFLKSNKLQSLFDFVDLGGWAKPGSYRLVAPYPRQAFDAGDCSSSFNELGLTSKQEALFLELV